MLNDRNISRKLKTQRYDAYEELVPQVGSSDEVDEYPFEYGFELFSAGLVLGYLNDGGELIGEAAERRTSDASDTSDDEVGHDEIVSFQQVLENNKDHAYTIEIIDRLIALDLYSQPKYDSEAVPDDVWNLVVSLADKGVGIIRQEWRRDREIDVVSRIENVKDFWSTKLDEIKDDFTKIPHRDQHGHIESGN